jgi:cytochrome P450
MATPLPPGPSGGLLGGRLVRRARRDPLSFLAELAAYGDIAHFRVGFQHVFFLNRPEFIEQVLHGHYAHFRKGRGIRRNRRLLGEGMISSEGDLHRRQRLRTQPMFHRERIAAYARVMARCAAAHAERWQDGETVDVLLEMRRLTMAIIGETMFSFESEDEIRALDRALEVAMAEFRPFRRFARIMDALPLPSTRRVRAADAYLEREMCRMIDQRRGRTEADGDLLTLLLLAHGEVGEGRLTDNNEVRDEALTIFLAGFETTSTALLWVWYLLAWNPDVEAEIHAELRSVLGDRDPEPEDVPRLEYTRRVFSETLRLYPPAWRLVRYAIHDVEIGGYTIPAGSLVVSSQFVTQRDARFFVEPLRFDPERWRPTAQPARPRYSYFPFGGGARRCIGEAFAMTEGVLIIATLARRWRFRPAAAQPDAEFAALQLLRPKETLRLILERRSALPIADQSGEAAEPRQGEGALAQVGRG